MKKRIKKPLNFSRGFWFYFVGDIDLSSNQMLEFLEFFNNEKE
ncbi:hypothetical protein FBBAL38_12690 [Flavobacteria bacterium BAL38]|nr:hypothetical protein FBBAL38_12690 [Flavobacteria bacterium BAL38]